MVLFESETEIHSVFSANMAATITDSQFLDGVLAARPQLLPSIRRYLEHREVPLVTMSQNKRKREAKENTGHLGELFDLLTPSYTIDGRPSKVPRYSVDSTQELLRPPRQCLEQNPGAPVREISIMPTSATESLEKYMERCFGVVHDASTYATARHLKRKRPYFDDDLDQGAILTTIEQSSENAQAQIPVSTATEGPPGKRVRTAFGKAYHTGSDQALGVASTLPLSFYTRQTGADNASRSTVRGESLQSASNPEWILRAFDIDFSQICPFSLYPNSTCVWGSDCHLKRVCKVKN
ncbi:MAG: hypothetical protein M1830_005131 [Pleopsidium flavum]|nr:MAG: hypothetical protein M1830_005131 [Pleopsidium flavum]